MSQLTPQTFIRHLPGHVTVKLEDMLNPNDLWENLAGVIPKDLEKLFQSEERNYDKRYSTGAVAKIHLERNKTRKLLGSWGTVNCEVRHLIKALLDARLFEAAKYLSEKIPPLESSPPLGAVNDVNNDISGNEVAGIIEHEPEDGTLLHMKYDLLSSITGDFGKANQIGTGGFGDVFLGTFSNGLRVAVKRLKNNTEDDKKQFDTEIKTLGNLRHERLVILLGYSCDRELQCLVYQYMPNGSLEDRLARIGKTAPLSVVQRVEIARGTAEGMAYLHTNGITHRDIKSANILLDEEFKPKIGDFATAKAAPISMKTQVVAASAIIGTQPYLAPEAYSFQVEPSLDIFSFGVVLLELITGFQAFDDNRQHRDLKLHVLEYCVSYEDDDGNIVAGDIYDLRDGNLADGWDRKVVENLYKLSQNCLITSPTTRIKISDILQTLEKIYD